MPEEEKCTQEVESDEEEEDGQEEVEEYIYHNDEKEDEGTRSYRRDNSYKQDPNVSTYLNKKRNNRNLFFESIFKKSISWSKFFC